MTILLLGVSRVALLEPTLEKRPGNKFYAQQTSAFIPWFPRQRAKRWLLPDHINGRQ